MYFPIKLNRNYWPDWLCQLLPSMDDPVGLLKPNPVDLEFTRAVSAFKFGSTFKTTERSRFPLTIKALKNIELSSDSIILDVGASDGVASLDAINSLRHSQYFVTDLNTSVGYILKSNKHYFFDLNNACTIISSGRFIWYNDIKKAIWPFKSIIKKAFISAPVFQPSCQTLSLFNPEISNHPSVAVQNHNLFNPWAGPKPHLIIAANILNRAYFNNSELNAAIKQLIQNLAGNGYMAIVDSREIERSSIFIITRNKAQLLQSINGGAETQSLVLSSQ